MPRDSNPHVRQAWRERLRRFQKSTTTVARFCDAEQVSTASFYAWRKRLTGDRDESRVVAAFLPVQMPVAQTEIRVNLPGGAMLELREGLSRERLQQVITATLQATAEQEAGQSVVDRPHANQPASGDRYVESRR